jgi:hypothetical protein
MLAKIASLVIIGIVCLASPEVSRKGAKAQSEVGKLFASLRLCGKSLDTAQAAQLPVEVFQVLDLPLSVHEASLVKSDRGYFVKLALGNSAEVKIVGLRYSLVSIDAKNRAQPLVNRTEGFAVSPYATKTLTFRTPLRFKPKDDERVVLMVEQVISREWIWEVVKAKDALDAYARGDYSVMPAVLRVANQVDAPLTPRVIYERR